MISPLIRWPNSLCHYKSNLDYDNRNGYIELPADADGFDQLYSLLLAAQTTKHPVWVRTNSAGECKVSYVVSDI